MTTMAIMTTWIVIVDNNDNDDNDNNDNDNDNNDINVDCHLIVLN